MEGLICNVFAEGRWEGGRRGVSRWVDGWEGVEREGIRNNGWVGERERERERERGGEREREREREVGGGGGGGTGQTWLEIYQVNQG